MIKYLLCAALVTAAAMPAQAHFTGGRARPTISADDVGPANPLISRVPARDSARINAIRSHTPGQYRQTKTCDSNVNIGNNDSSKRIMDYRDRGTYVGTLVVASGGAC